MKIFLFGLGLSALLLIIGVLTPYHLILAGITGLIALACLLIVGLLSETFVSGDRNRANYWTETPKDRGERVGSSLRFFLFGLPFLAPCILLFALYH
ncbi:hypothetical protein E4665_15350 [Sporolactobacillus shoreae]|uniref:DUF5316 domain-containing protein n=1 Tax=Sporolactobacillus shoreae TaxID=1465501 RepID=A0A4Z0GI83_9BACL|nr:DUF5316 domain-containing protein [Sporolactobacillus shoreae]TGA96448.1 hypothetical protein E4665_15350 [Sporolactobacillus shoreae]